MNGNSGDRHHTSSKLTPFVHALCWTVFIAYEMWLLWYSGARLEPAWHYALFYLVNIAFFYALVGVFRMAVKGKKQAFIKTALGTLSVVVLYLLAKAAVNLTINYDAAQFKGPSLLKFIAISLFRGGYFFLMAIFYWAATRMARYRQQAAEARNAFLQQQINPHLMLNTINFVYSRVETADDEAAHCLVLLSDLMRYGMESPGSDGLVDLEAELEQIDHLVAINGYRFGEKLMLRHRVEGDPDGKRILPLVLLTLVENIFKHGDLRPDALPASFMIVIGDDHVSFSSHNVRKRTGNARQHDSTGLKNIRLRLKHAYHEKGYYLQTRISAKEFMVDLKIPVHGK
ncbi:MAG: hypothetical protein BGO48_15440 [Mucilaginibacter sp. 44-25]|nr:MAG: hypothetical protein BGO48_15440 [Mucilaginibacter sp. 44-25]